MGLGKFLDRVLAVGLRLNVHKCHFIGTEAVWCGRKIGRDGWNYDSEYYERLLRSPTPTYKHELAQIVFLANWLSPAICGLSAARGPLEQAVGEYRDMRELKQRNEPVEWTPELEACWKDLMARIQKAANEFMATYDPLLALCLFTDASDFYWALMITQCPYEDLDKPVSEQRHRPIMFLSGKFTEAQTRWHISHKELFPIVHAFQRVPYYLYGHPGKVIVHTDHGNLVHILDPHACEKVSYLGRLNRWGLLFQQADIEIHHVAGEDNIAADWLSRHGNDDPNRDATQAEPLESRARSLRIWYNDLPEEMRERVEAREPEPLSPYVRRMTVGFNRRRGTFVRKEVRASRVTTRSSGPLKEYLDRMGDERLSFLSPYYQGNWSRITEQEIARAQRQELDKDEFPVLGDLPETEVLKRRGKMVIPESLVPRLIVHNHVAQGHPSKKAEMEYLDKFDMQFPTDTDFNVEDVVDGLRGSCLSCNRYPKIIRRRLGMTLLARHCKEVIHADYLYINKHGYILVIVDSLSRKTFLKHTKKATGAAMAEALLDFNAYFLLPEKCVLMTDNGSHFANTLLKKLTADLRMTTNFTVAYAPWTNGSAESANKPILRLLQTMVSEYSLHESEWPKLLNPIMHVLNNRKRERCGGLTPNQVFFGEAATTDLVEGKGGLALIYLGKERKPRNPERFAELAAKLQERLDELADKSYDLTKHSRELARNAHPNNQDGVVEVQYGVGEWVLVSKEGTPGAKDKTKLTWVGPYQVTDTKSYNVYEVRDLYGGYQEIHGCRMWFYAGDDYAPDEAVIAQFKVDKACLEVKKLLDLRIRHNTYEVLVRWRGFDQSWDSWEPLEIIGHDIEIMTLNFLRGRKGQKARDAEAFLKERKAADLVALSGRVHIKAKTPSVNPGWLPIEKEILRKCCLKYGIGDYKSIERMQHLPGKSTSQMYSQVQRICRRQALSEYHGLRADIFEIGRNNRKTQGNDFRRNEYSLTEEELNLRWCFNKLRYHTSAEAYPTIRIPYFRRLRTVDERRDYYEYLCEGGDLDDIYPAVSNATTELSRLEALVQADEQTARLANDLRLVVRSEIPIIRARMEELSQHEAGAPWSEPGGSFVYHSLLGDERVVVAQGGNRYLVTVGEKGDVQCTIQPPGSWALAADVREPGFFNEKLRRLLEQRTDIGNRTSVVLFDPPWGIAGSNPSRGLAIPYETMSAKAIANLDFSGLQDNGFAFVWVANSTFEEGIHMLRNNGYRPVEIVVWSKVTESRAPANSGGLVMQHTKELCLVGQKGRNLRYRKGIVHDLIVATVRESGRKPDELYQVIEQLVPGGVYVEIFARIHNLRSGWHSVGLELEGEGHMPTQFI